MSKPSIYGLLALGTTLLFARSVRAEDVRVYTDSAHPVAVSSAVSVVRLDAPADLQAELSRNLPRDPTQAADEVQRRLHQGPSDLNHRLAVAYQGVVDAWSLGILKVPAVLVDGRFVVYGDSDVAHAIALIRGYRGEIR